MIQAGPLAGLRIPPASGFRRRWPPDSAALRALQHRSFRLFFIGQSLSLPGTWMQRLAVAWLAYSLTGSAFLLGVVEFAAQIPAVLCAPLAGVATDRWNRKRLLVATQTLALLQAAVLAGLAMAGVVNVWHLIALSLGLGVVSAFDQTARQSLLLHMVDGERDDLASAIGLNSTLQTVARTFGPGVGGLIIAAIGEGACFVLNAASYLPVLLALGLMAGPSSAAQTALGRSAGGLRDGFHYVVSKAPIRDALLLLALGSLCGLPYVVLLPIVARELLGGGPEVLGFLAAASGAGSLAGASYVVAQPRSDRMRWVVPLGAACFALGLLGFAAIHLLWPAMVFLAAAGFGTMLLVTGTNVLVQTLAGDEHRGRVISWYAVAFSGTFPLGSLGAGALATLVGPASTILMGGAACLLGAGLIGLRLLRANTRMEDAYAES